MTKSKEFKEGYIAFRGTPRSQAMAKCPYRFGTPDLIQKRNSWFDGYDSAAKKHFDQIYHIPELQEKIRSLIVFYGLEIKYDAEYKDPYMETPEGYIVNIV